MAFARRTPLLLSVWLDSNEADEVSLLTWHWLAVGRRRPEEVSAWQTPPLAFPSSLRPASSLRPTNGTSARQCLPQPQTPAKLAGLAVFASSSGFPFGFVWSRHGRNPPHPHPRTPVTPPLQSGWQAFRQSWAEGVCWIGEAMELWMNHSRLVSAARGEMPSLPGCLSNKLAITGLGLQVNSMLLSFFFSLPRSPPKALDERRVQ